MSHTHPDAAPLLVMPTEQGLRLDQFLAVATTLSRRAARRLIDEGAVWRNGEPLRVQSRVLEVGDVISVSAPAGGIDLGKRPHLAVPQVLFEDEWVLAADKPSGVLSQPAESTDATDLAFDQLVLLMLAEREGHRPYLRMVHRLDRQTSGIVLFARSPRATRPLAEAWESGRVERRYLAIVEGHPGFDTRDVQLPIERDPAHEWKFATGAGGRPAHTRIRVIDHLPTGLACVECRLLTGRTHQVRVHLSEVGHPVAGDVLYGGRRSVDAARPLLHAVFLSFPHPQDKEDRTVVCPPPADFASHLTRRAAAYINELTTDGHTEA